MRERGRSVRVWRMFQPRLRAVATSERTAAKSHAASKVRKAPEIFILTFIIRRACSARLLVKGTEKSTRERRASSLHSCTRMSRLCPGRCFVRLHEFKDDVLRFLVDFSVPFTNNLAEQALRMMKVKMKISGAFRTFEAACD